MPAAQERTTVLVTDDGTALYYLGADMLLARAPIRDGVARLDQAVTIAPATPSDRARELTIRAAILEAWVGHDPMWAGLVRKWRAAASASTAACGMTPGAGIPTRVLHLPLAGRLRVELDA